MAVLVIADHDGATVSEATLKVLSAAQAIGGDIDVLVVGKGAEAVAAVAAKAAGVRKALHAESDPLDHLIAEAVADAALTVAPGYDVILSPSTSAGKNFMPRIAALLDVSPISDVIEVVDAHTFVRPIYAGNALETVQAPEGKIVATVRPTAFKPVAAEGGAGMVEAIGAGAAKGPEAKFVSEEVVKSDRPELAGAKIVVSGGRALGSAEEFHAVIEPLADKLGAAVGASRAAVDAGYAPNDYQVGQTGKVVAPQLYIAIGISGAIQHLAGMKDSKTIVAINKDADAPIFAIADYGLVADYKAAVPELMAELSK